MPTNHEVFREFLKAHTQAFAAGRVHWLSVPGSAAEKGAVAYWLVEGQRMTLTSCGGAALQKAKFNVYAWSYDGCSAQVAAEALGDLVGQSGTYLGVIVTVFSSQRIEDREDGDAYGCGVALEVHFRSA